MNVTRMAPYTGAWLGDGVRGAPTQDSRLQSGQQNELFK
jgi:hypothetical protein